MDLQPALRADKRHTEFVWERLLPLHEYWQPFLPEGGPIPQEAKPYFSPGFLWTRLPLGGKGDELISDIIKPAFRAYLSLYLDLVREAKQVDLERSKVLLAGQKSYMCYRANKDPARGMLSRFYGVDWTDNYIHKVLFDL